MSSSEFDLLLKRNLKGIFLNGWGFCITRGTGVIFVSGIFPLLELLGGGGSLE